ncbi:hypothetical protein IEQ34_018798 [Dendrobium chrysotoxum]|uniref:Uncharacterized protein n=1 Tax=Dendrobium chrysotoxum TaxID=161865 RepID=A0AAV7FPG6_DENCH|nr:hypothetical protein IEQ34_018798 [Dendrobium chrysotoxum]
MLNLPDINTLHYEKHYLSRYMDKEYLFKNEAKSRSKLSPSRVIEEFKKSVAFKIIVQDEVQEARDLIYHVEVKALELEYMEEGFIRGFLKGVRLVQRKTRAEIEGLTLI